MSVSYILESSNASPNPFIQRICRVLLAPDGTIIVVLAGQPNDASWSTVTEEASGALEDMRRNYHSAHCDFSHRRGDYWSVTTGITYGGGQPVSARARGLPFACSPARSFHRTSPIPRTTAL